MSIQRWWPDIEGRGVLRPVMRPIPDDFHPDDEFVTYSDHIEALREMYDLGREDGILIGSEQGQRDALAGAVQRVERLNKPWARAYMDTEVIAAIKGES